MLRLFRLAICCLAGGILLCGCAGTQVEIDNLHPDYNSLAPGRVAVLPMDNMSVDLDATPLVRPIVNQRILHKGYSSVALDRVDDILKEQGVLISHDVYGFTPQELGQMLGADAVVYGTVTEFTTQYAVIYASVTVGVKLEMADCRTGEVLWQSEHYSSEDTIEETLFIFLTERDIDKAIAKTAAYSTAFAVLESYRPYAERAVKECLYSLPPGHLGASYYPWDDFGDLLDDPVRSWMYGEHHIRTYNYPKEHHHGDKKR